MTKHRVPQAGSIFLKDPVVVIIELRRVGSDEPLVRLDACTIRPGDTIEYKYPENGIEFKFT